MSFRKLRIAFSATCLVACVLLIVLWARSYSRLDTLEAKVGGSLIEAQSAQGNIILDLWYEMPYPARWEWLSQPYEAHESVTLNPGNSDGGTAYYESQYFVFFTSTERTFVCMFISLPALLMAILSIIPWLRLRFGLRTLLIATTLIAVVLGLMVWLRG